MEVLSLMITEVSEAQALVTLSLIIYGDGIASAGDRQGLCCAGSQSHQHDLYPRPFPFHTQPQPQPRGTCILVSDLPREP